MKEWKTGAWKAERLNSSLLFCPLFLSCTCFYFYHYFAYYCQIFILFLHLHASCSLQPFKYEKSVAFVCLFFFFFSPWKYLVANRFFSSAVIHLIMPVISVHEHQYSYRQIFCFHIQVFLPNTHVPAFILCPRDVSLSIQLVWWLCCSQWLLLPQMLLLQKMSLSASYIWGDWTNTFNEVSLNPQITTFSSSERKHNMKNTLKY